MWSTYDDCLYDVYMYDVCFNDDCINDVCMNDVLNDVFSTTFAWMTFISTMFVLTTSVVYTEKRIGTISNTLLVWTCIKDWKKEYCVGRHRLLIHSTLKDYR